MTLIQTHVQSNRNNTDTLYHNLRKEFVNVLVETLPDITGKTHKEVMQTLAEIAFDVQDEESRRKTDFCDSSDDYLLWNITRNVFDGEEGSSRAAKFEQDMYEKHIYSYLRSELSECGKTELEGDGIEILIEASLEITSAFLYDIESQEESFQNSVDEILTKAYREIP